jgi:hypothetical protein
VIDTERFGAIEFGDRFALGAAPFFLEEIFIR